MAIPVILKGETPKPIPLALKEGYDYSGCSLHVDFCRTRSTFINLEAGGSLELRFTAEQTAGFPLGTSKAMLSLENAAGEIRFMPWAKIKVTNSPADLYDGMITVDPATLNVDDATVGDNLGAVKNKLNAVLAFLRGVACLAVCALPFFALADVAPLYTTPNDMPGDAPLMTNIVEYVEAHTPAIEMDADYFPELLVSVDETGKLVLSEYSADMFAEWDHTHTPQSIGAAPAQIVSYSFESPSISTNDIWLWQADPSTDPTNIIPLIWRDDMHGWCYRYSNGTTLCLECFTGEWNGRDYTNYWLMWIGKNYAKTQVYTYFDDTTPNEFVLDNRHLFRAGAGTRLPVTSFYATNTVVYTDTLAASTNEVARAALAQLSDSTNALASAVAAAYKPKQSAKTSPAAATTEAYQFIDSISQDANGEITATKKAMRKATTAAPGMVQLNDNIDSTRTDHAATANALRKVAENADAAIDAANAATIAATTAEASARHANTKATAVAVAATNYTDSVAAPIWSYVLGDRVWFAVTNYMRTISGVAPALQLWEVRDGATNLIYSSTEEITNLIHQAVAPLATTQALHEVQAALPSKAWSRYQSATGADNPEPATVTIVSTPVVQLTGGGEWQPHTLAAGGTVWTLEANGITTIGGTTNGYFVVRNTITGEEVFSVEERSFIPAVPVVDSFEPKPGGNGFVFSVYADARPTLYTATNLTDRVKAAWDAEGDDPNVIVNSWTNNGDGTWTVDVSLVVPSTSCYAYVGVTESTESIISNKRAVSFDGGVYVDSAKWRLGTATISGVRVLTVEAMP